MKKRFIFMFVSAVVLFSLLLSCNISETQIQTQEEKKPIFSFSFKSVEETNRANATTGTLRADTGCIYKKITFTVSNLTNEKQYLSTLTDCSITITLTNGHKYYSASIVESIMPEQSKDINLFFEVIEGESVNDATIKVQFSSLYHDGYSNEITIKIPSSAEQIDIPEPTNPDTPTPEPTEQEIFDAYLSSMIEGVWCYYNPSTQKQDGFYCFENGNCMITVSAGWCKTAYSINNGKLTINSNPITGSSALSIDISYFTDGDEIVAFSDKTDALNGKRTFQRHDVVKRIDWNQYSTSDGINFPTNISSKYYFADDLSLGYYFTNDGFGSFYLRGAYNTYAPASISWICTQNCLSIIMGSSIINNGVYLLGYDSNNRLTLITAEKANGKNVFTNQTDVSFLGI